MRKSMINAHTQITHQMQEFYRDLMNQAKADAERGDVVSTVMMIAGLVAAATLAVGIIMAAVSKYGGKIQ